MGATRRRLCLAFVAAAVLAGSSASFGQSPGQSSGRSQLDSELARATGVGELLQLADRYAGAGYRHEAKEIVDRAAQKARSSTDWQSVSAAYLRLGYTDAANAAQRRSRNVSR